MSTTTTATPATTKTEAAPATTEKGSAELLVDAFELKSAVSTLKAAIPTRGGALPVLRGVRFDIEGGVTVTGTDLDLTISVPLARATSIGHGAVIIPIGSLNDFLNGVTKATTSTMRVAVTDDGAAQLTLDDLTMTARVEPLDEWPRRIHGQATDGAVTVDTSVFTDVLAAASADDARPILTGVLVAGDRVVTTDSYRLHIVEGAFDIGDHSLLIPARNLVHVAKIGPEAVMSWTAEGSLRCVVFTFPDGTTVTSRLIEGEFPNYRGLIRSRADEGLLFTDPADLLAGVKELTPFCKDKTPLRIYADDNGMKLVSVTQDVHSTERAVAGSYEPGGDFFVGLNPHFLYDMLDGIANHPSTTEVRFDVVDHLKPVQIEAPRMVPDGQPAGRGRGKVQAWRQAGVHRRLLMPTRV